MTFLCYVKPLEDLLFIILTSIMSENWENVSSKLVICHFSVFHSKACMWLMLTNWGLKKHGCWVFMVHRSFNYVILEEVMLVFWKFLFLTNSVGGWMVCLLVCPFVHPSVNSHLNESVLQTTFQIQFIFDGWNLFTFGHALLNSRCFLAPDYLSIYRQTAHQIELIFGRQIHHGAPQKWWALQDRWTFSNTAGPQLWFAFLWLTLQQGTCIHWWLVFLCIHCISRKSFIF